MTDIISQLVSDDPALAETAVSIRRPVSREQAQASHDALFSPVDDTAFPVSEHWIVAAFVTVITSPDRTADTYAEALIRTPVEFSEAHISELRAVGLSDKDIVDVVQSAAFFNWANRLMLSTGRTVKPGVKLPR